LQAKIYQFPSPDDLCFVQVVIQTFLFSQTGISRRLMIRTIQKVLDRYRISRLTFPNFIVEISKGKSVIIFARRVIQGGQCPNCSEPIYPQNSAVRIMSIKEEKARHTVTYGCKCGTIFGKQEPI